MARRVLEYQDVMKQLVPTIKAQEDWAPLESLVAFDELLSVFEFDADERIRRLSVYLQQAR